jgi:hypothetical protein
MSGGFYPPCRWSSPGSRWVERPGGQLDLDEGKHIRYECLRRDSGGSLAPVSTTTRDVPRLRSGPHHRSGRALWSRSRAPAPRVDPGSGPSRSAGAGRTPNPDLHRQVSDGVKLPPGGGLPGLPRRRESKWEWIWSSL